MRKEIVKIFVFTALNLSPSLLLHVHWTSERARAYERGGRDDS